MDALLKIIEMFDGNKSAVAKKLAEISGNPKFCSVHINNWIERDKKVSAEYVIPLAELSAWEYKPHDIRADLYPHKDDGLPDEMRKQEEQAA